MLESKAIPLLPLLVVAAGSVALMASVAIRRSHAGAVVISLITLAGAFGSVWAAAEAVPARVTPLLIFDGYALFYIGLITAAGIVVALLAYGYLEKQGGRRDEFYLLLLLATLGGCTLVASSHFASFFLGLEILSVSLYGLIAYPKQALPLEAGIKYLVLAAASAAFLLFGMALVYAELGTMDLARIAGAMSSAAGPQSTLVLTGLVFIVTGIGFKLAVVPFHMWTPDVYQGAPAPVTAFIATVSKGAMFALLIRYFYQPGIVATSRVYLVFAIIAIASMVAGNVLALLQNNVKRILAYSSIAHLGYLLVAFQVRNRFAIQAVNFYLVAYFITTLGAFGVITALSSRERDADQMDDYRGLFWKRPFLTAVLSVMMFSLAGIPLTAGFLAKFYVIAAGATAALWAQVIILVVSSTVGLFYYLRVISVMYASVEEEALEKRVPAFSALDGFVLTLLVFLLFWFGVYPAPLLRLISGMLPL